MFKDISQDYYQTLGLKHSASSDEIKKAYKKLCLKYHPDKTPDKTHHELFLRINEAYEALKTEESRKTYDRKHGFNMTQDPPQAQTKKSMFTNSYNPFGQSTYSYYGFYKQFYSDNTREAEEEEIRLQREKAKEMERRDREREKAKKKKEEELFRKKREELLKKERERMEEMRMKEEAEAKNRELEQEHERQRVAELLYAQRKKEAYRTLWRQNLNPLEQQEEEEFNQKTNNTIFNNENGNSIKKEKLDSPSKEFLKHGYSSEDPIVVEDDNIAGLKKKRSAPVPGPEISGLSSPNSLSSDDEFVSFTNETNETDDDNYSQPNISHIQNVFKNDLNFRARQSPDKRYQKRQSLSPTRGRTNIPISNIRNEPPRPNMNKTSKRAKYSSFGMDDLKENLVHDISDVNFKDFYDSLPTDNIKKTRKTSGVDSSAKKYKRAEFSDGTSHADTLYTPINKNTVSGHSVSNGDSVKKTKNITVLDLHASPKIHSFNPPKVPLMIDGTIITPEVWESYVNSIQTYEKEFLVYKKHIVQYQLERCKKDEEYYDLINTSTDAFEVYQQCLQRDLNVIQTFNDLLREFNNTMNVYKQNCNWMKITNQK